MRYRNIEEISKVEKFLFKPIDPYTISQGFGENKACIDNTTGRVFAKNPYKDDTPCPPGSRSIYSMMKGHNGHDTLAKLWQPIYAAQSGWVVEVETEKERGLGVGIITFNKYYTKETDTHEHIKCRYWHHIALNVDIGDKVQVGDLIAYADSTGFSSGNHLHFEIKPVEISSWKADGSPNLYSNILHNNGYFGSVDPTPYMNFQISALHFAGLWRRFKEVLAKFSDFIGNLARK